MANPTNIAQPPAAATNAPKTTQIDAPKPSKPSKSQYFKPFPLPTLIPK